MLLARCERGFTTRTTSPKLTLIRCAGVFWRALPPNSLARPPPHIAGSSGNRLKPMKYQNVCLEAVGYTLPDEIVTSDELERRLEPLYTRLRLPEGRLELMTGIRERRFWPARHAAQPARALKPPKRRSGIGRARQGARSAPGARLGLPRLSGAGHGLRRAPSAWLCRPSAWSTTCRMPAWACSTAWCRWPT